MKPRKTIATVWLSSTASVKAPIIHHQEFTREASSR
jgi:hypothetical protein